MYNIVIKNRSLGTIFHSVKNTQNTQIHIYISIENYVFLQHNGKTKKRYNDIVLLFLFLSVNFIHDFISFFISVYNFQNFFNKNPHKLF